MARSEARISVGIWNDADFKGLSRDAQGMYAFLISQPDLLHIGLIGLRLRRWAQAAAGLTPQQVERDIRELEAARFVVVDWDAEELLIRTFLRGDKVYRQAQVLSVAAEQVTLVTSLALRVALRVELDRIATLDMNANCEALIGRMLDQLGDVREMTISDTSQVSAVRQGGQHPTPHPQPEGEPQPLGVRGVSTTVTTDSPSPYPLKPDPEPLAPKHSSSADALLIDLPEPGETSAKGPSKSDVDAAFEYRFWPVYPRKVAKAAAAKAFAKVAKEGVDLEAVIAGAVRYRDDGIRQRSDPKYTKHPAAWLNDKRWLDEAATPSRASPNGANGHSPFTNPTDPNAYQGEYF